MVAEISVNASDPVSYDSGILANYLAITRFVKLWDKMSLTRLIVADSHYCMGINPDNMVI